MADGPESAHRTADGPAPRTRGRDPHGSRPRAASDLGTLNVRGLLTKYVLLALLNALVLFSLPTMVDARDWPFVVFSVVALVAIDVIYLSKRFVPGKYLIPGTLFLLVFAVYPVLYTVYASFTNYGTGNILSKDQAIEQIERNSISATDDAVRYDLQVIAEGSPAGDLAFLLTDTDGQRFLGTTEGLTPLSPDQIVEDGRRITIAGYVALNLGQANDRQDEIAAFRVPSDVGEIANEGFTDAFAKLQRLRYDGVTNTVIDNVDGTVYRETEGAFVSDAGRRLDPGWKAFIGTDNYERINSSNVRGPFFRVFVWTFVFAAGSVLLTFALGLLLALVFANERMRGRRFYRLAMIVPYALPSFMTALVWKGMLNQRFGIINRMLGADLPWLDGQWLPYASILLVNLWLGFPYMFLVCTGALQGIPSDLKEAAFVDGATHAQIFFKIILPLAAPVLAVIALLSFVTSQSEFVLADVILGQNENQRTAAVGLSRYILAGFDNNWGPFAAGSLIVALPVILLWLFLQRFVVSGLTSGAVKG